MRAPVGGYDCGHHAAQHHYSGVVPKWAIFAPVFIPIFMRLGVAPQTVLAAYRG
ncbi:MAG: AbgT family transporter [Caldilineaceae bacterium]